MTANRGTAAALGNVLAPEEKMAGLGKSGNVALGEKRKLCIAISFGKRSEQERFW